jgi:hypothetical protein
VFGTTLISPVRPDGHGILSDGARRVAFVAEFDTGLEQHSVLLSKVSRYAAHVAKGGPAWPVLFWLSTTAREQRMHQLLGGVDIAVPVATAARDSLSSGACAADPVWLVVGGSDAPRRLVDLADLGDPAPEVDPVSPAAASQSSAARLGGTVGWARGLW